MLKNLIVKNINPLIFHSRREKEAFVCTSSEKLLSSTWKGTDDSSSDSHAES